MECSATTGTPIVVACTRPVQVQASQCGSMGGGGFISPCPLLRSCGQVMVSRGGRFGFQFQGVAAGRLSTLLWMPPHTSIQAVQTGPGKFLFILRGYKVGVLVRWGWIWEELGSTWSKCTVGHSQRTNKIFYKKKKKEEKKISQRPKITVRVWQRGATLHPCRVGSGKISPFTVRKIFLVVWPMFKCCAVDQWVKPAGWIWTHGPNAWGTVWHSVPLYGNDPLVNLKQIQSYSTVRERIHALLSRGVCMFHNGPSWCLSSNSKYKGWAIRARSEGTMCDMTLLVPHPQNTVKCISTIIQLSDIHLVNLK